jgi:hypothetical protein
MMPRLCAVIIVRAVGSRRRTPRSVLQLGCVGTPDEIASAVVYFCSDSATSAFQATCYFAVKPPSTLSDWPVMNVALSEQK